MGDDVGSGDDGDNEGDQKSVEEEVLVKYQPALDKFDY
jgi:hypothetical protein